MTRSDKWTFFLLSIVLLIGLASGPIFAATGVYNVRSFGAAADGKTLDTAAIQKAIDKCASAGGGQVLLEPGRYLSGTIHLKTNVTMYLDAGAMLIGTKDLTKYDKPEVPDFMPEAKWGKWHRALILACGASNISIEGRGVIDGNKVFDPTGEERMRGPHTFVFVDCNQVNIRDITFLDSANYAVFFQVSDNVDIRDTVFIGGWDGVHWRGAPTRDCENVRIVGCEFYTGDDCIAGRYWQNTLIRDCVINSSCNGIRLIGPAEHLIIQDCLFYGPGIRPHRTSDRHNMLAAVNLQPGAWDATKGNLDDVMISDLTIHNVATPFHISLKPGNTAGEITVNRVSATGVYRTACSVESWAEDAFDRVVFRDMTVEYEAGVSKRTSKAVKSPGVDARALPAWGLYARKVEHLELDNVRMRYKKEDYRPVLMCEDVDSLILDGFDFRKPHDAGEPFELENVGKLEKLN